MLKIIKRKIKDDKIIWLIKQVLSNNNGRKGMPLGNLTSQFFANVYLNELDYFVKHKLRAKYYLRYVDDFVILHKSKDRLKAWLTQIYHFLKENLKLELHSQKTRIVPLSRGVDFVGFRNYYHFRLLRRRNVRKMQARVKQCSERRISYEKLIDCFQGWQAYAAWANTYKLRKRVAASINASKSKLDAA